MKSLVSMKVLFRFSSKKVQNPVGQDYTPQQALLLVKTHALATFDETIDVVIHLNVDPKHGDQIVRGNCNMPNSLGKKTNVIVLTETEHLDKAKQADKIVDEELLMQMKDGKLNFTKLICTNDSLPLLKPLSRILGPKGLMPNAKLGTLVAPSALEQAIADAKKGQFTFRVDQGANLHAPLGKVSMSDEQIFQNFDSFIKSLYDKKPASIKGSYFVSAFMSSTMGPSWRINIATIDLKSKSYVLKQF